MSKIVIDTEYQGYTVTGWAQGLMEDDDGNQKPYYQLFTVTPCSTWKSETYEAFGLKAEKKRCLGPVWEDCGCQIGDTVKLFFDDKQRVVMAALEGASLERAAK